MKKGLDRLAEAGVKNVSLTNFDTIAAVAAESGYIRKEGRGASHRLPQQSFRRELDRSVTA